MWRVPLTLCQKISMALIATWRTTPTAPLVSRWLGSWAAASLHGHGVTTPSVAVRCAPWAGYRRFPNRPRFFFVSSSVAWRAAASSSWRCARSSAWAPSASFFAQECLSATGACPCHGAMQLCREPSARRCPHRCLPSCGHLRDGLPACGRQHGVRGAHQTKSSSLSMGARRPS